MANKILPKRSYTSGSTPTTSDLQTHELAINWVDGKAFTKNAAGNIVSVTLGGSGGGGLSFVSAPSSATATGTAGQIAYDGSYLYVCTATNTWNRAAISTWSTPVVTISGQPSNQTASSGAATLSVTASVTLGGSLTYQWQKSTDSGSTFANVSGATLSSLTLTSQTSSNNGDQYRVIVSSTGATSVTSSAATLTVAASFTATAVLLTSGTSYTVPTGASSMKAWAIGGGGGDNGSWGYSAGGCAYKTWSVSSGQTVTYAVGTAGATSAGSRTSAGGNSTVTFSGTTITGNGGGGGSSRTGGSYSGGDGGAAGGSAAGYFGSSVRGAAVGGNSATLASCGRRPATDVSGLLTAVALAGGKASEDCGSTAAFGSGGWADKYQASKAAGYGGGGGNNGSAFVASGPGAVVLYFS
jgi:hypothetical protein